MQREMFKKNKKLCIIIVNWYLTNFVKKYLKDTFVTFFKNISFTCKNIFNQ